MERRGISFETDAFVVDDHVIWGATARILQDLLDQLDSAPEPREGAALDLQPLTARPTGA
jgi:hypothetical protein